MEMECNLNKQLETDCSLFQLLSIVLEIVLKISSTWLWKQQFKSVYGVHVFAGNFSAGMTDQSTRATANCS